MAPAVSYCSISQLPGIAIGQLAFIEQMAAD
jgi:hypothetical protein